MFLTWCVVMLYFMIGGALQAVPSLDMEAKDEELDNFVETPAQIKCNERAKLVPDHENEKCADPNNITASGYPVLGTMPHMVMISSTFLPFLGGNHHRLCGGALISENFVLTSGECAFNVKILMKTGKIYVRLGEVRRNFLKEVEETGSTTQVIRIEKVFVHPKFNKETVSPYNIGLVRLAKLAQLNSFVRPACLQSGENLEGVIMIVSTWEKEFGDTQTLRAGRAEARPYEECNMKSTKERHNTFTEVCVKIANKICGDDSTNVLQTVSSDPYCAYYLVGSRGASICPTTATNESQKMFFTRIALFIPWIEKIVWP